MRPIGRSSRGSTLCSAIRSKGMRTISPEAAPSCGELSVGRRKNQEVQNEAAHDDRQREEPAPADDSRD